MVTAFMLTIYVAPVLLVFGVMVGVAEWLEKSYPQQKQEDKQ